MNAPFANVVVSVGLLWRGGPMKSGWRALYSSRETGESALRPLRRGAGLVLFAV